MKKLSLQDWISKYKSKSQRSKSVLLGAVSLLSSQAVNTFIGFFITGMLTRYLLPDEFGLWTMIMSFTGIFGGIDFGFVNALRNKLSQLYAVKDETESQKYFFSIFYGFIIWALIVSFVVLFLKPFINWGSLFNTSKEYIIRDGSILFLIGTAIFTFNQAFSVSSVGFFAYQESQWNAILGIISKFALLFFTFLFIKSHQNFISLNIMFLLVMFVFTIISFEAFLIKRRWKIISLSINEIKLKIKELFSKSVQFILLQVVAIVYSQVDLFLISKTLGLGTVGDYSLIKKLYLVIGGFHFSILMPVWSAYTEAVASNDIKWVKKILKKTIYYTLLIFISAVIVLSLTGSKLIYLWTGKTITNSYFYILLGISSMIVGWNNCFSVFLNANGILKTQIILIGVSSIALIPIALFLGKLYGITGICIALIITSLPVAVSNPIQTYKFIKAKETKTNEFN